MTSTLITNTTQNWMNYVIGSSELTGLILLLFIMIFAFYLGLTAQGIIIVGIPMLYLITTAGLFPINLLPIVYILAGIIIALAIGKLMNSA